MKLLSLYGVIAVALLVSCLAPEHVLSNPLKRHRRRHGQHDADRVDGNRGGRERRPGRRHEDHESGDGEKNDGQTSAADNGNGQVGTEKGDGGENCRGEFNGRPNWSIRPRYVRDVARRPGKGPLGLKENGDAKKRSNMRKAMGYMSKYGYMRKTDEDDQNVDMASDEEMKRGIRMMQKFMGLAETGELDAMTMMMMDKPRCGVRDVLRPVVGEGGENGADTGPLSYQHRGLKWDQPEITFRILNYPSTMPVSETREALLRAFRVWQDVTPLTFREVGTTVPEFADFYIKFGAGSHGDNFPFDGPNGVLAHAFLPKSGWGDLEGDIHFDDDELFTYASYQGSNLFQVAAHEIGHSLGLDHSTVQTALMAPFYPGYQPIFYLPYDDRAGIQSLYGSNPNPIPDPFPYPNPDLSQPTNPPTATTTAAPTTTSTTAPSVPNPVPTTVSVPGQDPCSPVFDAMTIWRGEFFAFTGDKYGRIRDYNILSQDGGSQASHFFQYFPGDIDALYEAPITYKLLMFKGPSYYVYDGLMLESGPNPITDLDPSLPSDLDAVVSWFVYGKTYFFKDELVWRFDEETQRVDSGWPYRIDQVWWGLPNKVTGAWHDEEQYLTYFLSGKDYYRYDDIYAEVELDLYPRDFVADFFGCF